MEQFPRWGLTTILSYNLMLMKFIIRRHISHLLQLSLVHLVRIELTTSDSIFCYSAQRSPHELQMHLNGVPDETRTHDSYIKSVVFYQLNYRHRKRWQYSKAIAKPVF